MTAAQPTPATPTPPASGTVIVGASVAGLHVAQQLRAGGYRGSIDLIDSETRLPYDRPPLSKSVLLGKASHDDIRLASHDALDALALRLHLGTPASGLRERTVRLADGREFTGEHVILATGLSPRSLAGQPAAPSVRTLRTLDDALALRERLLAGRSVAIIGGGLIGCEVASAGRDLGLDVTVIEALPAPMTSSLGARAGELFARLLRDRGVRLRAGARVAGIEADDDGATIILADPAQADPAQADSTQADPAVIAADTVLVAIGSVLNTGWLGPLAGPAGLVCDHTGQVAGHDRVYAVGDIASWPDPSDGAHRRREHWTSARTQAAAVAAAICGQPPPPSKPEYAWTDQFGLLIQILGRPELADTTVMLECGTEPAAPAGAALARGTVLGYFAHGRLVGALIFGAPRRKGVYNRLITAAEPIAAFADAAGPPEPFA